MYYAIAYVAFVIVILLFMRGAHVDDMDDPALSQARRWELRAAELRKVLALLPADDPARPEITKKRARVAAQLRHCETHAFNLLQRGLSDGGKANISNRDG